MAVNKKNIARNATYLYIRMLVTMLVSLYTSRIILDILGINEYGLYQVVGGIVAIFSFFNAAMSISSSRFLTYALGENNITKLKSIFSTTVIIHIILGLLIVIIAETIGLYILYNKINLPEERFDILFWVYQISVVTTFISIIQTPYTASIISHEHMKIYTYMSLLEVFLKLAILVFLYYCNIDKLLLYAILLACSQIILSLIYRLYCIKHFTECHFSICFDKQVLKDILSFSSWSLFSNISSMLHNQGIILLINNFFSPTCVAARTISLQINMVINQFAQNFRLAFNPQIVKSYAQGNKEESQDLLLESTKYSVFLILLISLPLLINSNYILHLWLKDVPTYTVEFVNIILIQTLFQTIDNSLYYGLYTIGKVKENSLISPIIATLGFPICYILFKNGYSPLSLSWCYTFIYFFIGIIVKPVLLIKIAKYSRKKIMVMIKDCFILIVTAIIVYFLSSAMIKSQNLLTFIISTSISIIILSCCLFYGIMEKSNRIYIFNIIKSKIKK